MCVSKNGEAETDFAFHFSQTFDGASQSISGGKGVRKLLMLFGWLFKRQLNQAQPYSGQPN